MSIRDKRILLISLFFILAVGCAFGADIVAYKSFGYYYDVGIGEASIFADGTEAFGISGCNISDGLVTVTGPDPQFVLPSFNYEFSKVRIVFRQPVSKDTLLQVFFVPIGGSFSEKNSVYKTIAAGLTEVIITLPKAAYTNLRFDFEENVYLDNIYIEKEERVFVEYKPHLIRLAVVFIFVFIPLSILFLIKTCKKKKPESKKR